MIPYGKQSINQDDIDAVLDVLQSDFLTQGPKVPAFEQAVAQYVGLNLVWQLILRRQHYILPVKLWG